jgi:hypothetical protein
MRTANATEIRDRLTVNSVVSTVACKATSNASAFPNFMLPAGHQRQQNLGPALITWQEDHGQPQKQAKASCCKVRRLRQACSMSMRSQRNAASQQRARNQVRGMDTDMTRITHGSWIITFTGAWLATDLL